MAKKLLLVDRESGHANALKTYLERQRIEVIIASTSTDAKLLLKNEKFDIIFANPYFTGTDIIDSLKFIKHTSQIQLILFGSKQALNIIMDEFGPSVTAYLEKPINGKSLDIAIKHAKYNIVTDKKLISYSRKFKELQKAQNLFSQLFNEVPCYISVQNKELRLTATNNKFKEDFGSEIGEFCYEIYKHRSSPCINCPVKETFADGKSHSTEEIVTSKSGTQYNVITQTAPIFDKDGSIKQVMEISTNITQIRQLQDHLSSLGLMLGSMSHGVKGMLTALDGGVYQLESGLKRDDSDRVLKASDQIKQMAERIKKMVLEILYYSKSRELQYSTIDIKELATTVYSMVRSKALKNNIKMKITMPDALGVMEIDSNWIQSSLVNLLENAVDACTYDTGKNNHLVEFSVKEINSDNLCFSIQDNGMGMDQETREKMFTLFFTSKGSQGTGLGLFIANHTVEHHGGKINVESVLNQGTCFKIFLPRKRSDNVNIK